ncbi:hypothetical protein H4217_005868 [Coemansia sp. RSA 1939]|nr:hypothetical protein H4217_005868 [Coemansia sp. RSA 1939]
METCNSNNRSSSSLSVSDTLSNCSVIVAPNTSSYTTAKNDAAPKVCPGYSDIQSKHSDLRGAILNAYHAECEAEFLRMENQLLKERCALLEEDAARPPRCIKPHGMFSCERAEIAHLKADKGLAQTRLERSERMQNLLKTDIKRAKEQYDGMYRSQRLMVDWLNARNKELKGEIGSLKSQLDAACAEARTHANAELAARTSVVAATNERSALKRQIWELHDQCTQLRVEDSKPTPCSRPHSASRPRTHSQATVDAATMTEPLQSGTTTALPTPPTIPQSTPRPEPQPVFSRYYTGDTLVYPGVETATAESATKKAAKSKQQKGWLDIEEGELLAPVLVPRQIGSPGYYATQDLIATTLSGLGYAISWDNFTTSTPVGKVPMSNIIATKNPGASRRLILAAHYESKVMTGGEFVGATDSAVPVALLLDVARGLASNINQMASSDISLQLVFFDGEEAYVQWTSTDSLYGARHLAEFWERNPDPATAAAFSSLAKQEPELERIDVMVLLDLIGAPDNAFVALQASTANLFMELSKLEHRLHDAGHINRTYMNTDHPVAAEYIEDDHIPFIRRNIPVLHLISRPFPKVWHSLADNASALDANVIADMSLILRSFVASYLKLRV